MWPGRVVAGQARKALARPALWPSKGINRQGKGWHTMRHMMIDIETLDTRPSAVVFQVGVVVFEDALMQDVQGSAIIQQRKFDLDIMPQIFAGRTMDSETINWWLTQKLPIIPINKDSVHFVFEEIERMVSEFEVSYVWSNSPSFDAVIMRSLAESLGVAYEFPSFRTDMDLRTLKNICKMKKVIVIDSEPRETTHDALQDALDQVDDLLNMMVHLKIVFEIWDKYTTGELVSVQT